MTKKPRKAPRKTSKARSVGINRDGTRTRARLSNADPLNDPRKRELQMLAYHAYVIDGKTYRAIGHELEMHEDVVSQYVHLEANRRAGERERERAAEIDRSCAVYNDVGRHYREKMDRPGARGDEGRYVIQAREAYDKLLGLPSAIKVKDETPPPPEGAIVGVSATNVTALLRMAIAAKPPP